MADYCKVSGLFKDNIYIFYSSSEEALMTALRVTQYLVSTKTVMIKVVYKKELFVTVHLEFVPQIECKKK